MKDEARHLLIREAVEKMQAEFKERDEEMDHKFRCRSPRTSGCRATWRRSARRTTRLAPVVNSKSGMLLRPRRGGK